MTARLPDLGRALLTLDDLPDGWVPTDPDALERLFQSRMPSGLCGVGAVFNSEIADAEVRATYRRTGEGPALSAMAGATFRGAVWSAENYITDVWVRRAGRWQVVRRHSSPVVAGAE